MSAEIQKDFWDKINEHVDSEREEVDRAFKEDGNRTIYIEGLKDIIKGHTYTYRGYDDIYNWENIDDFDCWQSMTNASAYNTWKIINDIGTTSYSWRYNDDGRLYVNTATSDPFHSIT